MTINAIRPSVTADLNFKYLLLLQHSRLLYIVMYQSMLSNVVEFDVSSFFFLQSHRVSLPSLHNCMADMLTSILIVKVTFLSKNLIYLFNSLFVGDRSSVHK